MLSHVDQLVEDVAADPTGELPPRERLRKLLRRFMSHYVGAASRQKVLLNELDNLPPDKRSSIVGKQRIVIDAVQHLVVALRPELAGDPARARVTTMLLFGMINWTKTWFDDRGPVTPDMIADMAFDMVTPDGATR